MRAAGTAGFQLAATGFPECGWWQPSKITFIVTFPDASEPLTETGKAAPCGMMSTDFLMEGEISFCGNHGEFVSELKKKKKSLSFTLRSTDVFWMLWTGRLAERVVIMHDKQNQSKTNCANLRIMLLSVFWLLWFHECAAHLSLCDVESGKHWQWLERRALKKAVFVLKHLSAAVIIDA